jgi:Arc/MetJ family transcription regulator
MSRTNIEIDDELMAAAMKASGQKTKRAVVEEGLRELVREQRLRQALERLRGIGWEGNLDEMRRDREFDEYGNRIDEP